MDFFVTKNCVLTSARVAVKIPDPLKILSHKSSEVIQFNTVLELKLHLPLQIPNRDLNCNGRSVSGSGREWGSLYSSVFGNRYSELPKIPCAF